MISRFFSAGLLLKFEYERMQCLLARLRRTRRSSEYASAKAIKQLMAAALDSSQDFRNLNATDLFSMSNRLEATTYAIPKSITSVLV